MKAKKLLSTIAAGIIAFSAFMLTSIVYAADNTAIIAAYNAEDIQVGTYSDIPSAIGAAGANGTVKIGEGTVYLPTGIDVQTNGITIEGAGMDKTFIKPESGDKYIEDLKNDDNNIVYKAKRLMEVCGDNITIKDMTIDGSSVPSTYKGGILNLQTITADFVPLRLSGGAYGSGIAGNITVENIRVIRTHDKKSKGSMQIGSNKDSKGNQSICYATAINTYIDGNTAGSSYADVDICENSTLTLSGGMFNGVILGGQVSFKDGDDTGYYEVNVSKYILYTTIPYVVDLYENNRDNLNNYIELMNDSGNAQTAIEDMAADLADKSLRMYGLNCDDKKALSQRFEAALNGIDELNISGLDLNTAKTTVNTANAVEDWHTWDEGVAENGVTTYTCNACGATKTETDYKITTEADAGYYAESPEAEEKSGIVAFKSFFDGYDKTTVDKYGIYVYNVETNRIDLQSSDTSALTTNEGSFVGKVTDIPTEGFDTRIYAKPYVIIGGETYYGDAVSTTVNTVNKWLGPIAAEEAE